MSLSWLFLVIITKVHTRKSQVLLDANYLTHDFSKSNKDGACESHDTSEFLWRALPEVHEVHTQAQTCGEKTDEDHIE